MRETSLPVVTRAALLLLAPAFVGALGLAQGWWPGEAQAQILPGSSRSTPGADIRSTRHNLSINAPTRQATSGAPTTEAIVAAGTGQTREVCVYCHTPHGSDASAERPLWNRTMSSVASYAPYGSSSLNSALEIDYSEGVLGQPSKLCLSCHDGTVSIGQVSNAPGSGLGSAITMTGTESGKMPYGRSQADANHGFTRRLGTDLRNDHPISMTYSGTTGTNLATADGELRDPATSASPTQIANRAPGVKPNFPLAGGRVQCSTCHDPHRNTQKFLLKNRLVGGTTGPSTQVSYSDWAFSDGVDQICVGCHTRLGKAWARSAHSDYSVADETYKVGADAVRDFPTGTKVWQAGCLNCHDTHTVSGSRRLLREGVTSSSVAVNLGYGTSPAGDTTIRAGVSVASSANYNTVSAIENTCYQCHTSSGASVISPIGGSTVPNISDEFARGVRMPVVTAEQGQGGSTFAARGYETHDITNANLLETPLNLGNGDLKNRHAECTDCHNPHRVLRNSLFSGQGSSTARTHSHAATHSNLASGALRGATGVEPTRTYPLSTWPEKPTGYDLKSGDPKADNPGTSRGDSYLTREYQLCFKCHSDYAYADDNNYGTGTTASGTTDTKGGTSGRPQLGRTGGTARSQNRMTVYTNQAAEWAVRATDPVASGQDQGEGTSSSNNGGTYASATNHRSWHPVTFATGRGLTERGISGTSPWIAPWSAVGTQTMYCSDCHGASADWSANVVQGPHGSTNDFLLRAPWGEGTNIDTTGTHLCFKCHVSNVYASGDSNDESEDRTGFCCDEKTNMHAYHSKSRAAGAKNRCTICHVAIPHGWKNKAFLVNLSDVGREGGFATSTSVATQGSTSTTGYTNPPYYLNAKLRVNSWQKSNSWTKGSCFNGESGMVSQCGGG